MPEDKDTLFGRLAVERGYVAQEQLDEAREAQERGAEAMGVRMPMAQILVSKGLLTKDQAQDLANAVAVQTGEASIVAGYEVVSRLGQGGMGAVYKARQAQTGQYVALKILPPSLANEAMVKRFQREAEMASKLDHEHIVGCVEFGFDKRRKCHFCALEFVEGEDLGKRLKRTGSIPEGEAVAIALQIARALRHANTNGLVHRDVKPENIMITPADTAKLLDLGLALPANMEATRFTQSGMFVGSPYYASPEQALGNREIDTRADVYSLGATLYHMVTGTPPFAGATVMEVLQKHVHEKVPWPADVNPELSDGVCRVIARMMAKKPEERYQDPTELIRDLDALAAGQEPEIGLAPLEDSSVAPAVKPRARRPRPAARARREGRAGRQGESMVPTPSGRAKVWIGLGAAAAAGVVIAVILATRGPEQPPPARTSPRGKGKGARAGTDKEMRKGTPPGAGQPTIDTHKASRAVPASAPAGGTRKVETDAPSATLTIISEPMEARVFLDAKERGKTPLTLEDLALGRHQITVSKTGYPRTARSVHLKPGEERVLEIKLGTAGGDNQPAGDWQTVCDGTSLDFMAEWSRKYWRVRDGALALDLSRAGGDEGLLSIPGTFRDVEVAMRFSLTRPPVVTHIGLGVRFLDEKGAEPEKQYKGAVWGGSLTAGEHEIRVTARGDTITATIDGKASEVTNEHSPREGRIQLVVIQTAESGFKIHSIRMREGVAVGPVGLARADTGKEPPSAPIEPLIVAFDALIGKGDHAAARRYAEAEAAKRANAPHAKTLKAAARVARELEARRKAIRGAVDALLGKEAEFRTAKGKLAGKVAEVTDEAIALLIKEKVRGGGAVEMRMNVKWADLVPEEEDRLARKGGWKAEGADGAVARAVVALSRKDAAGARKALAAAGEHPLAAHYRAKVAAPRPVVGTKRHAEPAPTLTLDLGRGIKMELVYIKPGVFMMGGTEDPKRNWQGVEKPKHEVAITRGFYMGKYEVTQSQHAAVTGRNPSKWKEPNRPVEQVTWHQAAEFCRLATERTREQFRLPTEAEWEFACRAGTTGQWCFGGDESRLGHYAWYGKGKGGQTHPVGQKKPNAWGLHDMHGNVWEWVADWYAADYYANSPRENPTGPDIGRDRLLRGGSWHFSGNFCRSAFRHRHKPSDGYHDYGFRAVVSASPRASASARVAYAKAIARAKMRVRLKNWKGAAEACEEALKLKPGDPEAKKLLAEAESRIGAAPTLTLDLGRGVTMELVYVEPGRFMMGSAERDVEMPVHEVAITRGFYMGKYEVTQAQYEVVMGANPSQHRGPDLPVQKITWNDAVEFCRRVTLRTRKRVRLPTEAEWEYACRAGSTGKWCFGDDGSRLHQYAWYFGKSGDVPHPVGQKKPNAWGLYDMHGNVWEWVADRYDPGYYAKSPRMDPPGSRAGKRRVSRGGSWSYTGRSCHSALRFEGDPSKGRNVRGFRAAASASPRASASARAAYAKAIARAKMRVRLKNWKGAAEACEEALKLKPGDPEATKLLAEAQRHLGPAPTLTLDLGRGVKMEMVYIKPGVFMMGGTGNPEHDWQGVEKPKHQVVITRGFYIGKYEVTQAQYEAVTGGNPSKWKEPNRPVEQVEWQEVIEFCRLATERTRKPFRLPTEAEWEFACRAGSTGRYCFGSDETGLGDYAWFRDNSGRQTHPVGRKKPNAWGLYDVHGNVWEWVTDWYDAGYYAKSPRENPTGPDAGNRRLQRGGSWENLHSSCRSGARRHFPPSGRDSECGFRAVVSAAPRETSAKPSRAVGITRGLVGWWKFDEMRGAVARDSSGRGNHGRIKGGAKWAKGKLGGALDFDGATGCVSVPRIVPDAEAFTYAVWISMDALPVGQRSIIHNVGWSHGDIHFAVDGHNQNRLQLGVNGIWPEDYGLLSSHAFSAQDLGKWFHVAVVYDTVGQTWKTYVNGKPDGGRPLPKAVSVRIGPALIGGWDNNQRHIDARLDDLRIYARALSAEEVRALAAGR